MCQLAELGQDDSELALCGGELALERRVAAAELPAREPDRDAQGQQALLRPVVEVALELPALRVGGRDEPRARETQPFELGAPRSVQALVLDRESSGRGDLLREARVVEQAAAVDEGGDLATSGHHAGGDAVGITWQGRRATVRVDPARLAVEAVEQPQRGVAESVRKLALEAARRR